MADLTPLINKDYQTSDCDSSVNDIADVQRAKMLASNVYSPSNEYSPTHVNALQLSGAKDDPTNKKGKGTGQFMDTTNGGSNLDIFGSPLVPNSGRNALLASNKYNPSKPFKACL